MADPVFEQGGGVVVDNDFQGHEESRDTHHHKRSSSTSSSSSSSDSESDKKQSNEKKSHLFGRKKPVHSVLGGGKPADIVLWRNKQISGSILTGATVLWILFERIEYHLLTFVCHSLILCLASLFVWSNVSFFVNKSPLNIPEVVLPEGLCISVALYLRDKCNLAFGTFREVASGRDWKKFFYGILGLWLFSVVGSWFDFLTLTYMVFVMSFTLPMLYEKHEDQVDAYAQKAKVQLKRQYSVLDAKVLKKLPNIHPKKA